MKIIPAKSQDADALTLIATEAKRHWGYPDSWIESWREDLTVRPEHFIEREIYSATVEGRIIAFYTIAVEAARLYLVDLWVLPEAMGNGIGRSLFTHALNRA